MQNRIRFEDFGEDDLSEIVAAFDRSVELMPQSDFIFFARCLFRATVIRDPDKVMSDAQRCYELSPNYPQAHICLGYGYLLNGDYERSVAEFREGTALKNDPYWTYRRFHMAAAQFCGGDFEGTIATLREMIELKPSVRGFRKMLVLALKEAGRHGEAAEEEALATPLDNGENFFVQEPALPATHLWMREALAPVLD